ncbi:hypothetical protein GCM10010435_37640 [Winogradskya consettensis]|uniref:TIGR04255 family protein n=2 Tax=Winogradskya consettensis TaxID=113560 RepID=A0A919T2E1_9ACTN|nr:hypothetical protein Aco04nite_88450 [Actinoplanes consettensis]
MQPAEQQEVALRIGPAGASSEIEVRAKGWQFASEDGALLISILPDAVVIQANNYIRWSASFGPPLRALLIGVEKVLAPELVHRIGLRYVNRLVDAGAHNISAWASRITPEIIGPIADEVIGPKMVSTQQQIELSLGDSQGALVRHGAFRDPAVQGAYSYLLDIDVFAGCSAKFDVEQATSIARTLNRTALSLFQHIVLAEYRDQMEPYTDGVDHEQESVIDQGGVE